MAYYDLAMLAVLLWTAYRGAAKGMAWQLAMIGTLLLCFVFATPVSLAVAPAIPLDAPLNRWVAMLVAYLGFSLLCFGTARVFRGWLQDLKFDEYDTHLGAVFGLLKGTLVCFSATFFLTCMSPQARGYVLSTKTGQITVGVMQKINRVLPREVDAVLGPYFDRFEEQAARELARTRPDAADRHDSDRFGEESATDEPRSPGSGYRGSYRDGITRDPITRNDDKNSPPDMADARTSRRTADESEPGSLRDLAESVPEKLGSGIRNLITDVVQQVLPGDERASSDRGHSEEEHISRGISSSRSSTLPPRRSPSEPRRLSPTATEMDESDRTIANLAQRIASIFTSNAAEQKGWVEHVTRDLDGVPDEAVIATLLDWYADLLGQKDPEPRTDVASTLETRLAHQIDRLKIARGSLPRAIQDRLNAAER